MSYIVYQHLFPNGKSYVGITCQTTNRRWRDGKSYKSNIRMTRAIKKYGWDNIKHIILAKDLTEDEACNLEVELIAKMDLNNPQKGYNIAPGGDHPCHSKETRRRIGEKSKGRKHSEEFKKWISEKNSGEGNYMYGRHHSPETIKKISLAKQGGTSPNRGKFKGEHPSSKRVACIDIKTRQIVKEFSSIIDASESMQRSKSCIQAALHKRQHTCCGYEWVYL